jgi:hypothetical protein
MNIIKTFYHFLKKQPTIAKVWLTISLLGYAFIYIDSFFSDDKLIKIDEIKNIFYRDIKRKELLGSYNNSRLKVDSTFGSSRDSILFSGKIGGSKNSFNFNGLVVIIKDKWVVKKVKFQQIKKEQDY